VQEEDEEEEDEEETKVELIKRGKVIEIGE